MKLRGYTLLLIIICSSLDIHAQGEIDLGNNNYCSCISYEILESNSSKYVIRFKIHKINYDNILIKDSIYHLLSFDSEDKLQLVGEPALPCISQHIGIPPGCSFTAELTENEWADIPVGKIYPAQHPIVSTVQDSTFVICDSIYTCEKYESPLFESSEIMKWKGIDNVYLKICPFIYHPSSGKLSVLSDFTFSVNFFNTTDRGDGINCREYGKEDFIVFDNYNFIPYMETNSMERGMLSNDSCDLLIIVGN